MHNTFSLKSNYEFRRLYHRGKNAVNPFLAVYCRTTGNKENRLGITVSTKVGKAVTRNLVRRRIREAYRIHEDEFISSIDLVVVARVRCADSSFQQIERALLDLSARLGLLKGSEK